MLTGMFDIAFYISTIILNCRSEGSTHSNRLKHIVNGLFSAAFLTTFLTTLLTTLLIIYRIHSVSRQSDALSQPSSRSFRHVLNLVLQSSAVYCIPVLFTAILQVIPQNDSNVWTLFCIESYLGSVFSLSVSANDYDYDTFSVLISLNLLRVWLLLSW